MRPFDFSLFTMVWGDKHIELFKQACFNSMMWPKNKASISGKTWYIFTKREHFEHLRKLFEATDIELKLMELPDHIGIPGFPQIPREYVDQGIILLYGMRLGMKSCIDTQKRMLFTPPDSIFGDGTVANITKAGSRDGSVVMIPHPRVETTILNDIHGPIDNSHLVNLAMKHGHITWKQSEKDHPENESFATGVLWSEISSNLYQVQHMLPTAYLIDFTMDDWNLWWGVNSFGAYDHVWPGDSFVVQGRQRFVGSSDACFIVEITEPQASVSRMERPAHAHYSDDYFNHRLHNGYNRQVLSYYRGAT